MAHKFNPKSMAKLDNPWRITLLPARDILLDAGLRSGQMLLDVGAGTGYFAFPASEIVGETGKVIAVDTSEEMVEELRKRVSARSVDNIEVRKSGEYDVMIAPGSVDMALMCAVLHEIDDRDRFLAMIEKALAPSGTFLIIEWEKKVMEMGPPLTYRLAPAETAGLLTKIGLQVTDETKYANTFYSLTAVRR